MESATARCSVCTLGNLLAADGLCYCRRAISCRLLIKMGAVDLRDGGGTANTALAYHAGRLLALNEGDLPYAVRQDCTIGGFRTALARPSSLTRCRYCCRTCDSCLHVSKFQLCSCCRFACCATA